MITWAVFVMGEAMPDKSRRQVEIVKIKGEDREVYRLSNGTLQCAKTGHFLSPPDDEHKPITQANAREMQARRYELAREAATDGLARLKPEAGAYGAWSDIVEQQAMLAKDKERGRSSTEAARFTGRAVGFLVEKGNGSQQSLQNHTQSHPPGTVLRDLLGDIELFRQQTGQNDE
jgi:hypothetical protein